MIGAAMFMGLRQVELRRAQLGDVETSTAGTFLYVRGKGGQPRRVYVPAPLAGPLGALVRAMFPSPPKAPIFHRNGRALSARGVSAIINKHIEAAGAEITPHGLRHSFITWLLNTGATLEEAMEIAGHTAVSSHEIYAAVGASWFWDTWRRVHPIASRGEGDGSVYVRGEAYDGHIRSGVERIVPLPASMLPELQTGVEEHGAYIGNPKHVSQDRYRTNARPLLAIREDAAIQMSEAGAHPFFLALVMGITPESVIAARFDRRGPQAERARIDAINRAVAPLLERGKENVA